MNMGDYLNPPMKAREIGRSLGFNADFNSLSRRLLPGEVLVGLYDRLIFKLAPMIPDAKELEEFESQYRSGHLVSHEFFAVPKAAFDME
jgi:hypothetical protein